MKQKGIHFDAPLIFKAALMLAFMFFVVPHMSLLQVIILVVLAFALKLFLMYKQA